MSVVVLAGQDARMEAAPPLARFLTDVGNEASYLGAESDPERIASAAAATGADAVDVVLFGTGAVTLIREIRRELNRLDRRDVSIAISRVW